MGVNGSVLAPSGLTGRRRQILPRLDEDAAHLTPVARFALAVMGIGLSWRLIRFALCFPFWGDEAMLCVNFVERDFSDLLRPLENGQVAPLLFVFGEWASYHFLGHSEYAMRLLPLLASCLSLPLFYVLARSALPMNAACLACALLSVSIWPVSMGSLAKPYSGDLFWALVLLVPTVKLLTDPYRNRWWWVLTGVAPIAMLASFPAVFIAGAVGLALTVVVWKEQSLRLWMRHVALGAAFLGAFALHYILVIRKTDPVTREFMDGYWRNGFAPLDFLSFPLWFLKAHVGQTFAYPIGSALGGSTLTFLLAVAGVLALWCVNRRLLLLLLAPFGFGLIASFGHHYPYGDSCRLAQYLAPSICLLTAAGVSALANRPRFRAKRERNLAMFLAALAAVGILGIALDLVRPYRDKGDVWSRRVNQELARHLQPGDCLVVSQPLNHIDMCFRWYLMHQQVRPQSVAELDAAKLKDTQGKIWCVDPRLARDVTWRPQCDPNEWKQVAEHLSPETWTPQPPHRFLLMHIVPKRPLILYCGIHVWTRQEEGPLLSSWAP